jgi:hypothetical protein
MGVLMSDRIQQIKDTATRVLPTGQETFRRSGVPSAAALVLIAPADLAWLADLAAEALAARRAADAAIDAIHGTGAAEAIDAAIADGSIFGGSRE